MVKRLKYVLLISFIFVVGCTGTDIADYADDDVVAIVRGEEITIRELRFLYPDEKALDMIEETIKTKLVMQEAKLLDIDVSEEINQEIETRGTLPPKDTDDSTLRSTREFAETQAKKFGLTPESYYENYVEINAERNAYMEAYIQRILGEPEGNEDKNEKYNEKANDLLNELVKENENEIEVLI